MKRRDQGNWRAFEDTEDRFDKVSKMKPRQKKSSKSAQLQEEFVVPEDLWLESKPNGFAARVVEVHKRYAFVSPEKEVGSIKTNDVWLATISRKYLQAKKLERNFIVVGDRVFCVPTTEELAGVVTDLPQCVIHNLAPRISSIRRKDPTKPDMEHILASNVSQILIVASFVNPTVKWGLIDRYLVLAEEQNIVPIIVLNKKDLLNSEKEHFQNDVARNIEVYRSLGYLVYVIQANSPTAKKNVDIHELKMSLKGKISMLSGHSGVGKSSIVNLFEPELVQAVEKNDDIFYKGRHTTSYASFIKLGSGGYLIDTPGIRSFALQEFNHRDLAHGFRDIRPFLGQCRYRECRHIEEPECAVQNAVKEGQIDSRRYSSYKGILLGTTGREGRVRDIELDVE
jgi:ribosome biogenesis GTPase